MDIKKFWKETFAGFVLKNFLIAIGIIVVLAWISLFYVDYYTHHGQSELVPDLRGSYVEEAQILLTKQGLYAKVIDSVYVRNKRLGTIIDQIPVANSTVKRNRPIYLIINSRKVRQVTLPDVSDVSYRQADAMLQSIGISVSNVEYAPSEYKDLVTEVKYHGRSILQGTMLPEGSSVVLVVGSGLGNAEGATPALKGIRIDEATKIVESSMFVIGSVEYDVTPSGNEADYIIYRQRPSAGTFLPVGSRIDIFLSKEKSRMNEVFEEDKKPEETEEQFF